MPQTSSTRSSQILRRPGPLRRAKKGLADVAISYWPGGTIFSIALFRSASNSVFLLEEKVRRLSNDSMGIIGTVARHLDALVGPGVMLLYPLYASIRAIETPTTVDDQQWLTYWVLYSLITLFELSCYKVLQWFPLWPYMKLLCCMWLVLPCFNGAAYIYENYVRKYVKIGGRVGSGYPEEQRKVLHMMSLDARKSVEHFIEKHGSSAFDRVVKAAEIEAKKEMEGKK
ncbi:hypothetical protein Taro_032559 [Colocasia esculenta]|uniref:HVA22-like protein n=1 Tax=Colocasia esculenta TaxID=4460 RepID=A0A843W9T3_COLES|nr:hypothetical protein [Colocasia esculenta]